MLFMSSKIQTLKRIINVAGKAAEKFVRSLATTIRTMVEKFPRSTVRSACKRAGKVACDAIDIAREIAGKVGCGVSNAFHAALEKRRNRRTSRQKSASDDRSPVQKTVKRSRAVNVKNKTVAVVPVYNHGETVGDVVTTLRGYGLPVILVDDGSGTPTAGVLDAIVSTLKSAFGPPVKLVRLPNNRGKGAAVMTGFRSALAHRATHVLQVDADGQHGLEVVPKFLNVSAENPNAVIAGYPLYDAMVPRVRFYGSHLSRLLVWGSTLSRRIGGPTCGFRLYPLAAVTGVLPAMAQALRMEFDAEIAARLDWENTPFINLPVAVRYPLGGFSNFRVTRDGPLVALMHVRLFFGMIRRLPRLIFRHSDWFSRDFRLSSRCASLITRISSQLFARLSHYSNLLSRRFRRP
jgi:glycosyltransferase involved in cell wall biosynthesis